MDTPKLLGVLRERLNRPGWNLNYNRKEQKLRVEDIESGKGVTISLNGLLAKYEDHKEKAIDEVVYYIKNSLEAMQQPQGIKGKENTIFPVIRSTSFPTETRDEKQLVYKDHTAESRIFYAIDMGQSYRLIDQDFMKKEGISDEALHEMALFNLRSLPIEAKEDHVAGNTFYFVNYNDGYDASRILNQTFIDSMEKKVEGDFAIAIPHQDVLIFADIKNKRGYDILAQMAMNFFVNGNIPITALPFLWEDRHLKPIFILAKNRPIDEED
jgi:uncharacterized protein YtpQ (UPF0354 family)